MQNNLFAHRLKQSMKDKNLKQIDIYIKIKLETGNGLFFKLFSVKNQLSTLFIIGG